MIKSDSEKITLKKFLVKNTILMLVLIFILNSINSFLLDILGKKIFAESANEFSVDYIFNNGKINEDNKIEKYGGIIAILNNKFEAEYTTGDIKKYEMKDLISLTRGDYEQAGMRYFGSFKALDGGKIGVVILPEKTVKIKKTITLSANDGTQLILYFFLNIILTLILVCVVILVNSKRLSDYLLNPVFELKAGLEGLSDENSNREIKEGELKEFSEIIKTFNKASNSIVDRKSERMENKAREKQLFADIRHDLKTPITIIEGYSKAILDERISEENLSKYMLSINKSAKKIDSLINQLLDIVEFERNDYKLNSEKIDICEYLRKSVIDYLPILENEKMNLEANIPESPIECLIDTDMFERVIGNLISNVIKHNDRGTKILMEVEKSDNLAVIAVADTGKEIGEGMDEKIFDLMFTGDKSRNSDRHSGIGLFVVKRIIISHGGEIYLKRNYKTYSKAFIITLPVA